MANRKFINIPIALELKDYQRAEKDFIDTCSTQSYVKSVYGFGTVGSPGISDLDYIVIVDKQATVSKKLAVNSFDKKNLYILSHNPFIFSEDLVSAINIISNFGTAEHKWGSHYDSLDVSKYDQDYSLLILIDYCNYFYPRIFLSFLSDNSLDVRLSIQLLNALSHSIQLFKRISGNNESSIFDDYINDLKYVKENFFNLSHTEVERHLTQLLEHASMVSVRLIIDIDEFITKNYWTSITKDTEVIYKYSGYLFTHDYDEPEGIISRMNSLNRKLGGWVTVLPTSFAYPVIKYAKGVGPISRVIKKNLIHCYGEEKFIYFVKDVPVKMTTRIGLLNRHYAFYNQSRIKVAPVHDYYQMSGLRLTNNSIKLLNV